jgi:hypothetical protein
MQLTKLRAAPVRRAEVPPCAPAGKMDGVTASQLIRGVGWTRGGVKSMLQIGGGILLAWVVVGPAVPAVAMKGAGPAVRRPLVLTAAGITLGLKTLDSQVVGMFGQGCYIREEGHGGGRYFINSDRSLTLHTIIGVDNATDYVELSSFPNLPKPCIGFRGATSKGLAAVLEIEHGVRLGMSLDALVLVLGSADSEERKGAVRTLIYRTDVTKDDRVGLDYEARYRFTADRLTQLSIYDGE